MAVACVMSVQVSREGGELRVANARLELCVQLDSLRMRLRSASGATQLRGFQPRVITERGALMPTEHVLDGWGTLRTRAGIATRVHVESRLSTRLWLCADIDVGEDWPGVALRFTLVNRGIQSVRVDTLDSLSFRADEPDSALELSHRGGTQILEMGFHSDASSRWRKLGSSPWLQPFSRARRPDRGPFTPAPAWGLHVSDFVTSLRCPTVDATGAGAGSGKPSAGEELTLGFISHDRFLSFVYARAQGGRVQELTASSFSEALRLPPRARLSAEKLWLGISPPGEDGLTAWATRAGLEMLAPVPGRQLDGCIAPVDAHDAGALAEALDQAVRCRASEATVFEVAGNYAPQIGDWLVPSDRFPHGPSTLAHEIRAAGLTPRIWIAPFLASASSRLVERHPDWVLRDAEGAPIEPDCELPEEWGAVWALDASHPDVIDWLKKLGDTIRGLGFDQIALRYLDAGLLPGARRSPELGAAEAYRQALAALRGQVEPSGPARLIGERAPLGPSIGLLDVVRCGPDWGPHWSPRLGARGVDPTGCAEVAVRNVLVRAPLHQRLWTHEIGPIKLGAEAGQLESVERLSLAVLAAACGSPIALADPPARLSAATIGLFRQLSPASGRPSESLDARNDGLVTRFPDGSLLVFRLNFSRRPHALPIDLASLGARGPVHAWDILGQRFLTVADGLIDTGDTPGHGCTWIRVTPIDDRPRVVGSGIHLCGGALEASRLRVLPSGALAIRLQLPGPRFGEIWVTRDARHLPLGACVAFEGNLEFALSEIVPEPEVET